jgi:hypothetical protein
MRVAKGLRGKTLVAIISVIVLLLALFAFQAFENPASSGLAAAGPSAAKAEDAELMQLAKPLAKEADTAIAANLSANERSPSRIDSGAQSSGAGDIQAVEAATGQPAAAPDEKPQPRSGTVAAECWSLRGSAPWDYVVTLDREVRTSGKSSALISALRDSGGYATMFQTSAATPVRGKRVRFSADIRTQDAADGANLLLRAEDAGGKTVAFDNMQSSFGADRRADRLYNRGVMGTTEFSRQQVVVDIPDSSRVITYGVSLFGGGKIWIDNASIEVVGNATPTTAIDALRSPNPPNGIPVNPDSLTRSPRNLEFDLEAQPGAAPCN